MRKKLLCLILALLTVFGTIPSAFARQPKDIYPLAADQVPEPVEGQHHYLLMCVDQWQGKKGNLGNTDGMVLVTLDTRARRVMLTSFIRDLLVMRPDGKIGRINYIAKNFGPEALCNIISTHFGVKVEKYILFDMKQVQEIINHLGGVDITVTDAEANYLRRYAISKTSTTPSMGRAGTYRFGGHAAVIYMRIRKAGGGGDFMRTQRVRTVLSTLADQCREISYEEARALVDSVMENSTLTNMSTADMVEAMEFAMDLRGVTVEELRLPIDESVSALTYVGMSVQECDFDMCRKALDDYLQNSFLVLD